MVNGATILEAIREIVLEKDIKEEDIVNGIKEGFKKAYERFFDTEAIIEVDFNEDTGMIELYQLLTVVQKVEDDWLEIGLNQAKEIYGDNVAIGDVVRKAVPYDTEFSRSAVHQVRQIVQQKIRSASREQIYNRFVDKKNQLLTGKVVGMNEQGTAYLVDVDGTIVSLWAKKLIPGDDYKINDFITFYVEDLEKDSKFSQIVASRTAPGFLEKILEGEIPEIGDGIIEVKAVSRQPGVRSKIAVVSHDENVEPIGSIVGVKGNRINRVSQQLNGEKIDVVKWSPDMNEFIINAMAPVRVISVDVDEENNEADIIVPNEQSSLAIGRQGMAARLVANLLHMKINIIPLTQAEELGIEVKWNGNISPAEVESKEFLENTQRRRTNARRYQPHQNFENQEPAQEPVDLENLQAFQDELLKTEAEEQAAKEEAQLMRSRAQEAKTREAETEEMSKALEDLQKNLAAIDDVLNSNSDDEDYDDYDDEDIESDDYDEYYDK